MRKYTDDALGIDDAVIAEMKKDQNARANADWPSKTESAGEDTEEKVAAESDVKTVGKKTEEMTASQRRSVASRLLKMAKILLSEDEDEGEDEDED